MAPGVASFETDWSKTDTPVTGGMKARVCGIGRFNVSAETNDEDDDDAEFARDIAEDEGGIGVGAKGYGVVTVALSNWW